MTVAYGTMMCMGRQRLNGPVTQYVAASLEATRIQHGLTYDAVVEASGLSKSVVVYSLKGRQGVTVDAYVMLCDALSIDPGELLDAAADATSAAVRSDLGLAADNPGVPTDRERMEQEWGDDPA